MYMKNIHIRIHSHKFTMTHSNNLERFDSYLFQEILKFLSDEDVKTLCISGLIFARLCSNEHIWIERSNRRCNTVLSWKSTNMSYFQFYFSPEIQFFNKIFDDHEDEIDYIRTTIYCKDVQTAILKQYSHALKYLINKWGITHRSQITKRGGHHDYFGVAVLNLEHIIDTATPEAFRSLFNSWLELTTDILNWIISNARLDLIKLLMLQGEIPNTHLSETDDDLMFLCEFLKIPGYGRYRDDAIISVLRRSKTNIIDLLYETFGTLPSSHVVDMLIYSHHIDLAKDMFNRGVYPTLNGVSHLFKNGLSTFAMAVLGSASLQPYDSQLDLAISAKSYDVVEILMDTYKLSMSIDSFVILVRTGHFDLVRYAISHDKIRDENNMRTHGIVGLVSTDIDLAIVRGCDDIASFLMQTFKIGPSLVGIQRLIVENNIEMLTEILENNLWTPTHKNVQWAIDHDRSEIARVLKYTCVHSSSKTK